MVRFGLYVAVCGLLLAACGDSGADGSGGSDGDDDDGDGPTTSGPSTSPSTGTEGSGGSTSTGSTPDERLYPLEVGRTWTYDVQSTYPSCPSGMRTTEVLGETNVDGKPAFRVVGICGDEVAMTVAGNVVESKYQSYPWLRLLDEPVEEGHTWTTTNGAAEFGMTYSYVGDVTTPAGTFSDCWRVTQEVSYTQDWTYCPGVGNVASTLVDLGGGSIIYELVSKSF